MNYYIGADLGTSSCKLLLIDENKIIINKVSKTYDIFYPHSGWSEQNPADWWNAFKSGVRELIGGVDGDLVKGITVAGQMHGLVILDKNDNVIRPAILWNDSRCHKETDYLNNQVGKNALSNYTGNIAFAGFTAPKILWLKNNEKENFDAIKKIMLPKDYINYCLTGLHTTDYSDASGMLLLDVKNKCWSKEMLQICGVSERQMPKLYESYEKIGNILPYVASELGLNNSVYVTAGTGDNAGAAIGTGTVSNGSCNISLGTSGTIFISADRFSVDENNSMHSFCHADGGYHLMGCMLSAASCNQWFCGSILNTDDYNAEQIGISDDLLGNNTVYFLPYLMGERSPINDTDASGMFIGLRADTSRQDMVLSVLEGVAFAVRDNMEIAKKSGIIINKSTVCGGGAKSDLWLKILASVLNIELQVLKTEEGPSYGAALISLANGDRENLKIDMEIKKTIIPQSELVEKYNEKYDKFKKIYPTVKSLYKELKEEV